MREDENVKVVDLLNVNGNILHHAAFDTLRHNEEVRVNNLIF